MHRPGIALTPAELAEIRYRYEMAERWLEPGTWCGRVNRYGPYVAQAVLRSFNDIPRLLEALDG